MREAWALETLSSHLRLSSRDSQLAFARLLWSALSHVMREFLFLMVVVLSCVLMFWIMNSSRDAKFLFLMVVALGTIEQHKHHH